MTQDGVTVGHGAINTLGPITRADTLDEGKGR
jgi:hypothetical protein